MLSEKNTGCGRHTAEVSGPITTMKTRYGSQHLIRVVGRLTSALRAHKEALRSNVMSQVIYFRIVIKAVNHSSRLISPPGTDAEITTVLWE